MRRKGACDCLLGELATQLRENWKLRTSRTVAADL
eukprot:COSAG06_NODE_35361_length_461_cov_0.674033_1_plen_34_part_01